MTSSSKPSPSPDLEDGVDVRSTAVTFGLLVLGAAAAAMAGVNLGSFGVVFAGLPVSAVFTVLGGEFVVAWPIDAMVWLVVATWPGRQPRLFDRKWRRAMALIIGAAIVFGFGMGLLVEPTAAFG